MPKILFINDNAALIECAYVPNAGKGKNEEELAAKLEETVCRPKCGYYRDSIIRNNELVNKSKGKQAFKLLCLNPKSPYLAPVMKKLKETGNI